MKGISAVFIDSREPEWVQHLSFGDAPTTITPLDYGDLWVACDDGAMLVIERKTPDDLLNSIRDGRLFLQADGIRKRSPWAYLLVTGVLNCDQEGNVIADYRRTKWQWDSVQGALLNVQESGIGVVFCRGDGEYEAAVQRLAARSRDTQFLAPRLPARILTAGEVILSSLPGIGLQRTQQLLGEYDNHTAFALAWLTETGTISEIAGIGDSIKYRVREALSLAPGQTLCVTGSLAQEER